MQDRREFSRVPSDLEMTLLLRGEEFASELKDLSLKGALVNTAASPLKGSIVDVRLTLVDTPSETVVCKGRVIRADSRGLGIQFEPLAGADYEKLRDLVAAHSEDPARIHEEYERSLQAKSV